MPIIDCGKRSAGCHGPDQCQYNIKAPQCKFLKSYRENLEQLDINNLIQDFQNLEKQYQQSEKINEEITMVLIVYETPNNPCSERVALIDYFNSKGIDCRELEYPIK